mmetsp:Transcript_1905/g.4534  ORF Transcript_1905/g.4534 Transcript_1905/m.4534 type:complete len:118 (-) Transcript_1905:122-475(-)
MSLLRSIAAPIARLPFMRMLAKENGRRLQSFGLQYEDLLIVTPEVQMALDRLSPEQYEARNRRLKRAIDMSLKHEHMSPADAEDPYVPYLRPILRQVREEIAEQEAEVSGAGLVAGM